MVAFSGHFLPFHFTSISALPSYFHPISIPFPSYFHTTSIILSMRNIYLCSKDFYLVPPIDHTMDCKDLVRMYFEAGFSYVVILRFMKTLHSITLSLRTLKRLLSKMGLRRRNLTTDLKTVADHIEVRWTSYPSKVIVALFHRLS